MVAGARVTGASWCQCEALDTEIDRDRRGYGAAVYGAHDVDTIGRCLIAAATAGLQQDGRGGQQQCIAVLQQ